jgi:hypothetical protein
MQTKMGIDARSGAWMVKAASIFLFACALSSPLLAQVGEVASPTISASSLREGCKIAFPKDVKYSHSDPLSSGSFDIRVMWMCVGSTDVEIDRYEIEGGSPEIVTVLFWKRQKAVILVRWSTNSQASDFQGDYYKVYVYDYNKNLTKKSFIRRGDIDKRFGEGWDGVLNGKQIVYKYKDAQSIKSRLKKIGY